MRSRGWMITAVLAASLGLTGCEVEQTREGEAPDLDVDVSGDPGQLPAYDFEGPDIDIGVEERTVSVPKVRFETEREEVKVPYIDINLPGDEDEREERELAVEFDVDQGRYDVNIEEIRAKGDQLFVIARIEGDASQEGPGRVSDRVMLNAPDADVRYYVIGDRPPGSAAQRYHFVSSESSLPENVRTARVIYQDRGQQGAAAPAGR